MPAPSTLALFALAAIALIAIPGPNMLFVAAQSMSGGRRTGFAAALGLLTGTLIYVAAAAAGVAAIIASSALAFDALRYLGAAYLIYLGIKAWRTRDEPIAVGVYTGPRLPAGDRRAAAQPQGRAVLPRLPAAVRRP